MQCLGQMRERWTRHKIATSGTTQIPNTFIVGVSTGTLEADVSVGCRTCVFALLNWLIFPWSGICICHMTNTKGGNMKNTVAGKSCAVAPLKWLLLAPYTQRSRDPSNPHCKVVVVTKMWTQGNLVGGYLSAVALGAETAPTTKELRTSALSAN